MSRAGKILLLLFGLSVLSYAVIRFLLGGWIPFLWLPIGLAPIFFVASVWVDRATYLEFLSMKTTKKGMSMGALIGLVLVLLVAINFIAIRKYKTFDFSVGRVNTLSDQSVKLVKGLDSELKISYFYKKGTEGVEETRRAFIDLVKKYQDQSPNVKLEFVELNERPDLAEQYGVNKGTGVVFLEYKGRKNKIEKIDEQELTGAIVKVTREKDKTIYFVIGHGEKDMEDAQEIGGANALKKLLEGNRYQVKALNLNQTPEIPADADLVLVVGPTQNYLEHEEKALENYLARGGSLVLALKSKEKTGLEPLLTKVGAKLKDDYVLQVVDTMFGRAINPKSTGVTEFSSQSPITKPFGRGEFVVMRLPTALQKSAVQGLQVDEILKTSATSMAFSTTDFEKSKTGEKGPFTVGLTVKGKWPGTDKAPDFALVIFGDADFLSNQLLYQNLNRDLALNTVAYLSKEENVISITPKEVGVTKMNLTSSELYLFVFGFVIPLPVILLAVSGTLWFRRRNA